MTLRLLVLLTICLGVIAAALLDGRAKGRNLASTGMEAAFAVVGVLVMWFAVFSSR